MTDQPTPQTPIPTPPKRRYVPAVGPRLMRLLQVVFGLFALLCVNSVYLLAVRGLEKATGAVYQNWFSLLMFLGHLVLGAVIVVPVILFGIIHMRNTHDRRNRRAVKVGYALFAVSLIVLASGIVLTRLEGIIVVKDPTTRSIAWWIHVLTPVLAAWLFVLHRLAGKKIRWNVGLRWAAVAGVFAIAMLGMHSQDPRRWNVQGPESGEKYFFPSLARTSTGNFIPESVLMSNEYCLRCHEDSYAGWEHSVHRFSSFNNPPYLASVRETRQVSLARDGDLRAARWCAGCHDPVVFFSGKFDDPHFDDVNDPTGQAGITCVACHSITSVDSTLGNANYTIEEPLNYPFAFSDNERLRFVSDQLVKAKPELHRKTYLKPFHKTAEFCSSCHKVHLPPELNDYKWLRGQNHYDTFLLSGVSGHGVGSFYYPPKATTNCAGCHMPLQDSDNFGARDFDGDGQLEIHDHMFPGANTAIPKLVGLPDSVIERHRQFNEGVMRLDLFALRRGGETDGTLLGPLRPELPTLEPGERYLVEAVIRTVKMGHPFTQGTADSNEVWLDAVVHDSSGRVVGRSGGMGEDGRVDPWSHFVNIYMLDREGRRIDRRNAQDIFTPLYNHQIPPGAADVVHLGLEVPEDVQGPLTIDVKLRYRKFDTTYMKIVYGQDYVNTLPILTLAHDRVELPVAGGRAPAQTSPIDPWQRWNDYGIGLLRKGGKTKGELAGAEYAFQQVEALGRPDGPINLARVYLAQGTVQDQAIAALERAAAFDPPAPSWLVAWFSGLVDKQNGNLDRAIDSFRSIVTADTAELRERGFDFSKDWRVWNELGQTLVERARMERGDARREAREALLRDAAACFEKTLTLDAEDAAAHYNLAQVSRELGDADKAAFHLERYQTYKPDDNARDRAIAVARAADPAANHAAEAIVIYDLHRDGAFELGDEYPLRGADRFEVQPPPSPDPTVVAAGG